MGNWSMGRQCPWGTVACLALSSPPNTPSRRRLCLGHVFPEDFFEEKLAPEGCVSRSTALAFSEVGFVERAPGNSATDRPRTAGIVLRGERTPSRSAAEALRAELQRRVRRPGSPARLLRPLRACFFCEKTSMRRAGPTTCAGARFGKRAAAAAKLQLCKHRALQSERQIPRAEQRGSSDPSGNGSPTRLSRREQPRHRRCPEEQQLPPEELPRLRQGLPASRAAQSTCSLSRPQDPREARGLLKQDLMAVFTNTSPVLWDWEVVL